MTAATPTPTSVAAARRNPWSVAAVALLPLMILGLLLAALWNPQDRLDQVPAAIVNLDEPVEVQGQTVPLGRQFASGLVSGGETADGAKAAQPAADATNFDWTITDEETATDGLANGTYAAVVTIPKNFSAAATSMGNDDPSTAKQATIDVSTPPGGRVADDALARVVAATATSVLSSTLTETYVDNVLVGFNDLSDGIGQAQDGANQLADGADQAAGGATKLSDGAGQLADGAGEAAGGASKLSDGAGQLADGASSAASGASGVASGASGLADGAGQLAGGASALADGADQVATGAHGVADGVAASADGADKLADGASKTAGGASDLADGAHALAGGLATLDKETADLPASATELAEGTQAVDSLLGQYFAAQDACTAGAQEGCDAMDKLRPALQKAAGGVATGASALAGKPAAAGSDPTGLYAVSAGIGQSSEGATKLAGGADDLADGAAGLSGGVSDLADGLADLESGATKVAGGAEGVASGASDLSGGATALGSGASKLAGGASQLSTGVGQLATGATGVASGAADLSTGVGQLATGTEGLATGASDLSSGVGQLATGAGDLSDGLGDAKGQIPTTTDDERTTLSSVVAQPVKAPSASGISMGASGPLFAVVALWLGALALLTIFPPVLAGALGSTRDSVRLALRAFTLPAAVGAVTGAAVGVILAAVESLDAGGWVGAILVGAVASVAFVAVHQGFVGLLGNLGRGISLLIAVLLIATGIVATVPTLLQGLVDALPVGAARDALTAVVVPAAGGLGMGVTLLVLWGLGGLALATLVTARGRRLGVRRLLRA
ncbi:MULTISPECIES: YhgE/Pip family protein [unclassified Isoptericola]|uniref:YhgE/Pip family protein n=1 Tax=unclassified Isoptericola TaxID=2623355 RepID=UPI003659021E